VTDLPFGRNDFSTVAAFEVLEHLPEEKLESALSEIHRVSERNAILSVPDTSPLVRFMLDLPGLSPIKLQLDVPNILKKRHHFDGEHYWELGKKGFSKSWFRKLLNTKGFSINKSYRSFECRARRMFVLEV
jgi:ubiquinone/menaquinone biosynthesis C-methylase UbiE